MTKFKENFKRVNLKRKVFAKGKKNFKKFKRTPQFVRDNPENKVAREKQLDAYDFVDSEEEKDDLGMGIDLSDLPFLEENHDDKQKEMIALTQDSVRPFFADEASYDETKLTDALKELRHSSFRGRQKETVKRILFGRSTLFISPTGSGKSLCYQLPALLYWRYKRYITIVVSPLISLMEDQMSNFPPALKTVSLHSGHTIAQRRRSIEQLHNGEAQVAFVSPEAIVGGILELADLKSLPPVGFVCIDEAHCLSEWSHNFRPAYMQFFRILNEQMSIKTYLGLTATATKATAFAISRNLIINPETDVIGKTTVPDNLILSVSCESNKEKAIIDLLKSQTFRIMTSIIVYCNRRDETERVASRIRTAMQNYKTLVEVPERVGRGTSKDDSIKSTGSNSSDSTEKAHMQLSWHAEAYHAGLSSDTRKRIHRQFIKGEIRVVVATIAFGMGINKANVRAIIHYDMPGSFESYVQEIGRAGRDGKPAQCHMFLKTDKSDLFYQQRNIYASITEHKNLRKLMDYLFRPCRCESITDEADIQKVNKLNQNDTHELSSWDKTHMINTPVQNLDDDDLEDYHLLDQDKMDESNRKKSRPTKFTCKSIVRKHRHCCGHEIAFPIEEASEAINLKPESIITLICRLQQAYPQLQIKQYPPAKSTCNLFCYRGSNQLKTIASKERAVQVGLGLYKREHDDFDESTNKITFDIIKVAYILKTSSADTIRALKKIEWELVEETGRFRRSQVRVTFSGNSFHLNVVGDLSEEELEEIYSFLKDYNKSYEEIERNKLSKVFHTLQHHCIEVSQMTDKAIRLAASSRLKSALNAYFELSSIDEAQVADTPVILDQQPNIELNQDTVALTQVKENSIRIDAKAFIAAHEKNTYTPRNIARIFQGISTPNYPAEIWGKNRRWWRIHLDVDFQQLTHIIEKELAKELGKKS